MPRATVLIPTFNHGRMLRYAALSAASQTVRDVEIFIVGDGVPDVTREVVCELQRNDDRIRFFDNPKGPRHGELHRHQALLQARGDIVCYLSDDDLWLPRHVESMEESLRDGDFAQGLKIRGERDGSWTVKRPMFGFARDLTAGYDVQAEGTGAGLSHSAHTMAIYRALPHGWRTAPADVPTDRHMWRQILAQPEVRLVLGTRPTAVSLPSSYRKDMNLEERAVENEQWSRRIASPTWREQFLYEVHDQVASEAARLLQSAVKRENIERKLLERTRKVKKTPKSPKKVGWRERSRRWIKRPWRWARPAS